MHNKLSEKERRHLLRVKERGCSVCDASAPSEAHHVKQGSQYTAVALCESCHRGALMGIHGQRRMWAIAKMDELDALNVTVKRLMGDG